MRARTIFIVLLVLILVFALWPTALTINGEEWGQTVYELQWAYLSLFTIPVGEVLLAIWLAVLPIYLVIRFIHSRRTQSG